MAFSINKPRVSPERKITSSQINIGGAGTFGTSGLSYVVNALGGRGDDVGTSDVQATAETRHVT